MSPSFPTSYQDINAVLSSEEILAGFLEHSTDGLLMLDEEGRVSFWNERMEQFTGLNSHSVIGQHLSTAFSFLPEAAERAESVLASALPSVIGPAEVNGALYSFAFNPLGHPSQGLPKGVLGIVRKVNPALATTPANKPATLSKAEPTEQVEQLLEGLQLKFALLEPVYDTAGNIFDFAFAQISTAAADWLGQEKLAGQYLLSFWPGAEILLDALLKTAKTGEPQVQEARYLNHGTDAWVRFSAIKKGGSLLLTWEETGSIGVTKPVLMEEHSLMEHINQAAPMLIVVLNLPWQKLLYVNRELSLQLGYRPQEVREMQPDFFQHVLHPEDVRQLPMVKKLMASAKDWEVPHFQFRLRHKAGHWLWHSAHLKVYKRDEKGLVTEVLALVQEIDETRATRDLLRGVLNSSTSGMVAFEAVRDEAGELLDLEWKLLNPQAEQLLGQRSRQLLGKNLSDTPVPLITPELGEKLLETLLTRRPLQLQHRVEQGQQEFWLEVNAIKVEDGLTLSLTDITGLKNQERELRERQHLLQTIFDTAPFAIILWTLPGGEVKFANSKLTDLLGYEMKELADNGFALLQQRIHPRDLARLPDTLAALKNLNGNRQQEVEVRARDSSGEYRYLRIFNTVFSRDESGLPLECLSMVQDKTQARRQEQLLLEAQELVGFGIFERNMVSHELFWSEGMYRHLGYTTGQLELSFELLNDLLHPEDRSILTDLEGALAKDGQIFTYRMRHKDGSWRTFSGTRKLLTDANGNPIRLYGLVQDVTEQLQQNEELQRVTQLSLLNQLIPQMIFSQAPDGSPMYLNDHVLNYFGLPEVPVQPEDWKELVHPDDRELTLESWANAFRNNTPLQLELRLRSAEGEYRWHLVRNVPVSGQDGRVQRWYGTATDIQELKENEAKVETLNFKLSKSLSELGNSYQQLTQINQELDQFVYRASYDLQAPLQNLEGLVGLLIDETKTGLPAQQDLLQQLDLSISYFKKALADLTEVLKVERSFTDAPTPVGLAVLIENARRTLTPLIESSKAAVSYNLDKPAITGVRSSLNLLITRLLQVALQYPEEGQAPRAHFHSETDGRGNLILTMETNSSVLDEHQTAMAFRLFHRSYRHLDGVGISLYPICQITEHLGGKAEFHCTPGKGCTYRLTIPLVFN